MTGQISDQLVFKGKCYCICGEEGKGMFNPEEVGITPVAMSTACWRGYICKYTIANGFLELVELIVGEGNLAWIKVKHGKGKEILGKKPTLHKDYSCAYYEELNYKVNFTGTILVCDDFIRDLYVHMGFQSAYKYKKVYELFFDSGTFLNSVDCSEKFADIRQEKIKDKEKKTINNNPAQKVLVDKLGWVTCPNCLIRFATYDKSRYSWDGERHIGCQQLLILVYD